MRAGILVLALAACNTPGNGGVSRLAVPDAIVDDDASSIDLSPNDITIVGEGGVSTTTTATVSGTGTVIELVGVEIQDPALRITFDDPACAGGLCTFPGLVLPHQVTLRC